MSNGTPKVWRFSSLRFSCDHSRGCSETRCEFKIAFNRAAGAASITVQSRWTAKSQDGGEITLTFNTKGEIIILSNAEQRCPQS